MKFYIRLRIIFLIFFICLPFSCTSLGYRLAYNNLDFILIRILDSDFDINTEQKTYLKKHIKDSLEWHRTRELPKYLAVFKKVKQIVSSKKVTKAKINWFFSKTFKARNSIFNKMKPGLLHFLQTLSDEQLRYFEEEIKEDREEIYEKEFSLTVSRQIEMRFKKFSGNLEYWFSYLTKKQKKELKNFIINNFNSRKFWYDRKYENQKLLIENLRNKSKKKIENTIKNLYTPKPKNKWLNALKSYILKFANQLTKEQHKKFVNRITNIEEVIQKIIIN